MTVGVGVHLIIEGGQEATAELPLYGGGFVGYGYEDKQSYMTLEVSGVKTQLDVKGTGVAGSLYALKALTLSDGLKITAPVGAAFDEEEKAVCRSDGSVVAGEWVVIKGQN